MLVWLKVLNPRAEGLEISGGLGNVISIDRVRLGGFQAFQNSKFEGVIFTPPLL